MSCLQNVLKHRQTTIPKTYITFENEIKKNRPGNCFNQRVDLVVFVIYLRRASQSVTAVYCDSLTPNTVRELYKNGCFKCLQIYRCWVHEVWRHCDIFSLVWSLPQRKGWLHSNVKNEMVPDLFLWTKQSVRQRNFSLNPNVPFLLFYLTAGRTVSSWEQGEKWRFIADSFCQAKHGAVLSFNTALFLWT